MTHVIREDSSPDDAYVWTMWCGEQCIALDDGTTVPEGFDFYHENSAAKASCVECLKALLSRKTCRAPVEEPTKW